MDWEIWPLRHLMMMHWAQEVAQVERLGLLRGQEVVVVVVVLCCPLAQPVPLLNKLWKQMQACTDWDWREKECSFELH